MPQIGKFFWSEFPSQRRVRRCWRTCKEVVLVITFSHIACCRVVKIDNAVLLIELRADLISMTRVVCQTGNS